VALFGWEAITRALLLGPRLRCSGAAALRAVGRIAKLQPQRPQFASGSVRTRLAVRGQPCGFRKAIRQRSVRACAIRDFAWGQARGVVLWGETEARFVGGCVLGDGGLWHYWLGGDNGGPAAWPEAALLRGCGSTRALGLRGDKWSSTGRWGLPPRYRQLVLLSSGR